MPDLKLMPLACPYCGCEAGRYDFGPNNSGDRYVGHSQWPCGFNLELTVEDLPAGEDVDGRPQRHQEQHETVFHTCQRVSK
jgi:hypothetical protein